MPLKSTIEISLSAKMEQKADKNFTWTDDEVALIFSVILDYKGLDWETIQAFAVIVFSSECPFLQKFDNVIAPQSKPRLPETAIQKTSL